MGNILYYLFTMKIFCFFKILILKQYYIRKPKKELQQEDQSPGKDALNLFKQNQKLKEDTITEQIKNGGTMLKQDSKHASEVIQGQDDHIKQRNEKKVKKFENAI